MGWSTNIHFGPYLEIVKKIATIEQVQSCTNMKCANHQDYVGGPFCSKCGSKVDMLSIENVEYPTLYELEDKFDIDEDLFYCPEYPDRILLPNGIAKNTTVIDSENYSAIEIGDINVKKILDDFRNDPEYAVAIKALKESGIVELKFGIVNCCS